MTLFSFVFTALFLAFVVAAIVGHALLIEALLRPFFGKVLVPHMSAPSREPRADRPLIVRNPEKAASARAEPHSGFPATLLSASGMERDRPAAH